MADLLVRNFTGFEPGNPAGLNAFAGNVVIVGDGTARTGDFCLKVLKRTAATGSYTELLVSGITSVSGGGVTGRQRAFIRIDAYASANNHSILGFGNLVFQMEMDTTGHFRARTTGSAFSAYSSAVLALGVWYEVRLTGIYVDNPAGNDTSSCTVEVVGVETVIANQSNAGAGPFGLGNARIGGDTWTSAAIEFDADDWFVIAGSNAEQVNAVLPSATRISPVTVTAQGALADFTGDYRAVLDVPYEAQIVTDQTSAVSAQSTTFTHRTRAALGVSNLAALKVYATAKASVAAAHAILIRGTEYSVNLGTGYPVGMAVPHAIDWTITDGDFDSAEWGLRNKTGATVSLANVIAEALHDGTPVDLRAGSGSYAHQVGQFTGDGTFHHVGGVGLKAQALFIKPLSGAGAGGVLWLARAGGTRAVHLSAGGAVLSAAVVDVDSDGFTLTPSSTVNQSGVVYAWLAIQDGGGHATGDFFRAGTLIGDAVDNREFVIPGSAWGPEIGAVFGGAAGVYRTPAMLGDLSAPLNNLAAGANMIQALTATGFQLGSDIKVNEFLQHRFWIAWRNSSGLLDPGITSGAYAGTGAALSISTALAPSFAWSKPATAVYAYWRSSAHTGSNSMIWPTTTPSTTAITALTGSGFDVGVVLSVSGQQHYWVAFSEALIIPAQQSEVEPGLGESFGPLVWSEYATPPNNEVRVMAGVDLADPASYYGGYKEPRMLKPGVVVRALSDEMGQYQGARFRVTYDDKDRYFRDLEDRFFTLQNRRLVLRMIDDPGRRQQLRPRTVAMGIVRDYQATPGLTFELEAEDYFALYTGLGSNDVLLPRRLLSTRLFADLPPEADGKPIPILYGDLRDAFSVSGPVTGVSVEDAGSSLPQPTNLALTPSATGGQLPTGKTLYVRVLAKHAGGESLWTGAVTNTVPGSGGMQCVNDDANPPGERMNPCRNVFAYHISDPGGSFTKFRWCFVTGIRFGGGVWYETDPTNWGALAGHIEPNIGVGVLFWVAGGMPGIERVRLYVHNIQNFHPQNNPNGPIGVEGDSVKVCRVIESSAGADPTLYSRKTGGRPDSDYCGDANASGYTNAQAGDDGILGTEDDCSNFLACFGDDDGEDYLGSPVGPVAGAGLITGSMGCAWTAAPGAIGYRVFWTEAADWTGTIYYADVAGTNYTITQLAGASTAATTRQSAYVVTAIMPDGETAPSSEVSITQTGVTLRPAVVSWTPKQGASGYYVYRRQGTQDFDRRWTIPANPAGMAALRTYFTDDFNDSDATVIAAPKPQGVYPLLYLGQANDLNGDRWHRFLVAGHAVTAITDVYQNGLRVEDSAYGDTFAVPGKTGWTALFGPVYTEVAGERFTFLYTRGAPGDAAAAGTQPLSANVQGIETVGDGTGILITDLFDQYEHFLRNWVLRDYRTGPWFTSGPTWGDTPYDVDIVDSASFSSCKAVSNTLLPGGFVGAFVIGLDPSDATRTAGVSVSMSFKQETVRTWIARLNQSADCYSGFSRHSQFVVRMITATQEALSAAPRYTHVLGINAGSFSIDNKSIMIENQVDVRFKRNWAATTCSGSLGFEDKDAQARVDEIRPYTLTLWAVRVAAQANVVGRRRLERRKYPVRLVSWESDMGGLTSDLGDLLRITHPEGIGAQGWTDRPVFVLRHEFDPARFVVRFVALDVQWAFTPNIANVGFLATSDEALILALDAEVRLSALPPDAGWALPFDLASPYVPPLMTSGEECEDVGEIPEEWPVGDIHTMGP